MTKAVPSLRPHVRRRRVGASIVALVMGAVVGGAAQYQGWLIPDGGRDEKSPLSSVADAATQGKAIFALHCVRCHGPEGKGNGPDSDHAADLTDDLRNELNPEGVLFYKVWNGHAIQLRVQVDDMPAFREKLSRDEVWAVVEYLKVLRTPRR
jgi:mono/diheme cytochrome c family protein